MTLIVEDGTGVANANTYATRAEVSAFAALRGATLPTSNAAIDQLLVKAADYTEAFRTRYQGTKVSGTQALQFPRVGVYVDGFLVGSTTIPDDLKNAQMQAAVEYNTVDLLPNQGKNIKKKKVDVIETEYQDGDGSITAPTFPKVDQYLDALFAGTAGAIMLDPIR